jgi:quercetin dioxygenase-like cupin family protein/DNA-binding XRE family transcriptional regulator
MDAQAFSTKPRHEVIPGLGARLRERRLRSGMTLEKAATRVGLSPAHLSRLEADKRQPSLSVLLGLSRAYAAPLGTLLGPSTAAPAVIRGAAAESTTTSGWTCHLAGAPGQAMRALRVHLPPDFQDPVARAHPGEEWLYVLTGRLVLTLDHERHLLEPGDSAHFDSMHPHHLAADTASGADVLLVHAQQSQTPEVCHG